MTTHPDRPNTALMVIDVQNGVVTGSHDRDGVVGRIASLVDKARAEQVPVVWVQHNDEGLERDSEPGRSSPSSRPTRRSRWSRSTTATPSRTPTSRRSWPTAPVGRVVVTGAQSDACIRSTLHGALVRGYDVTLVGDAHTTEDLTAYGAPTPDLVISHTNLSGSGRRARHRPATSSPRGRSTSRAGRPPTRSERADGRGSGRPTLNWRRNPKASRVNRSEIRRRKSSW